MSPYLSAAATVAALVIASPAGSADQCSSGVSIDQLGPQTIVFLVEPKGCKRTKTEFEFTVHYLDNTNGKISKKVWRRITSIEESPRFKFKVEPPITSSEVIDDVTDIADIKCLCY